MNIVRVRGLALGEGIPKICVPITGRTREEILLRTEELKATSPDLAEWRADWYEDVQEEEKLLEMLPEELKEAYKPVLNCEDGETEEIVKAADKISAYIKCVEELKAGNGEFRSAEEQIRRYLEASPLPEVKYFMEHFMPAFGMTLDELTK